MFSLVSSLFSCFLGSALPIAKQMNIQVRKINSLIDKLLIILSNMGVWTKNVFNTFFSIETFPDSFSFPN